MSIHNWDGVTVLDLGDMDIWDGADLALRRETLHRMIEVEGRRSVGVNIQHVKYIPSGFFGMLYDWHEKGVVIHLYSPLARVRNMLWFRQFFTPVDDEAHLLHNGPVESPTPETVAPWFNGDEDWENVESYATGKSH